MAFGVSGDVQCVYLVAHGGECTFGISSSNAYQFSGSREGKRPEKDAAHQTENGSVRADSKSECKCCNRRESKALVQLPKPKTNVLHQSSHFLSFIRSAAL
jgi:hypothetical protein